MPASFPLMNIAWFELLRVTLASGAGVVIGLAFGLWQQAAWRRHERLERDGRLGSGWAAMPGSMSRVGLLLVALVLIQVVCPLLFVGFASWWVSGGLLAGYGWVLARRIWQRRRELQHGMP